MNNTLGRLYLDIIEMVLPAGHFDSIFEYFQGELFPSHARSFGSGLIGFLQMISLFISAKMVPTLTNLMGTHGLFYLYSVLTLFVAFICSFAMPDTSGLSLEEIENIYKKKQKSEK